MNFKILLLSVVFSLLLGVSVKAENYIVKIKSSTELSEENEISQLSEKAASQLKFIITDKEAAEEMLESGLAEYIARDEEIELLEYNDKYFERQWNLVNHNILALKEKNLSGKGVRIAVIDSGIYADHSDFQGATILEGFNYRTNSEDTSDLDGHGTSVAGIIAAQENNSIGIAGIAPEAEIVPLVVYQNEKGSTGAIMNAMIDAVDKYDCKILNISLGGYNLSSETIQAFQETVDYVVEKGAIIFAAAGNKGDETYYYPAACENVIGLGSCDSSYNIASTSEKNDSIDFTASGVSIYTLSTSGGYKIVSGTSFASPTAAAAAALLVEANPDIDYYDIMEILKAGCIDYGNEGYDESYGYGFIDALESYNFMMSGKDNFISAREGGKIKVYSKRESLAVVCRAYGEDGSVYFYANDFCPQENLVYISLDYSGSDYDIFLWESLYNMKPIEES